MESIGSDLPRYGASEAMAEALIRLMSQRGLQPGDPFLSDFQVMEITGKSRTSVRRAMNKLREDGWIERRDGVGTFVGPRLARYNEETLRQAIEAAPPVVPPRFMRLGILGSGPTPAGTGSDRDQSDRIWLFSGLVQGLGSVSLDENFGLELLGGENEEDVLARLDQSPPEVMICAESPIDRPQVWGRVAQLNIPVIASPFTPASPTWSLVQEDSTGAMVQAVHYLVERGHRHIAYLEELSFCSRLTQARYEGWRQAMLAEDLQVDTGGVLWLTPETGDTSDALARFLDAATPRPTAVICGSWRPVRWLGSLVGQGRLTVPRDLSVVVFDANPQVALLLGGIRPATFTVPFLEWGKSLAHLARMLLDHDAGAPQPLSVSCVFSGGESVLPLAKSKK